MQSISASDVCNLYPDYNPKEKTIVQARYAPVANPSHQGNPFIEALPRPYDKEGIIKYYSRKLPVYDNSIICDMSAADLAGMVLSLRDLRFPLPFHADLEWSLYETLCESYAARRILHTANYKHENFVNGDTESSGMILVADDFTPPTTSFALLGLSGSGKTASLELALSKYPQVIAHKFDTGNFKQIVYLVVNCPPNSNFQALYINIGIAIDRALKNPFPVYEKELRKAKGLQDKYRVLRTLVERFAIGVIIFDEIQQLDFSNIRENTFTTLLTLNNQTKLGIVAVGTDDAYRKMFPNIYTARRVGKIITSSSYCEDKEVFSKYVIRLSRYQFFGGRTVFEPTKEVINTLFQYTGGIIAHLISIYIAIHYEILKDGTDEDVISVSYVDKIVKKYFSDLSKLVELDIGSRAGSKAEQRATKESSNIIKAISDFQTAAFREQILIEDEEVLCVDLERFVCSEIQKYHDYDTATILAVFRQIYKGKKKDTSPTDLIKKTLKKLSPIAEPAKARSKISQDEMRKNLGI